MFCLRLSVYVFVCLCRKQGSGAAIITLLLLTCASAPEEQHSLTQLSYTDLPTPGISTSPV